MKKSFIKHLTAATIFLYVCSPVMCVSAAEHSDMHDMEQAHDHGDNPVITKVMFDQLEIRDPDTSAIEAQLWTGTDINKLWLKTDIDRRNGKTEDAELQALYSRAIATFWDVQLGIRKDIKPEPTHSWGVIGIQGLAPYFFDVDASLFIGNSGHSAARLSVEYELLFTQHLILSPNVEVNFYGQNEVETGTGAGLSDTTAGLRLRYEILREFAPYLGVNWNRKFGTTADFARNNNESISDTEWVLGVRAWF